MAGYDYPNYNNSVAPDGTDWRSMARNGLPGVAGNFGQFFSNMFGGNTNPGDAANQYLKNIPGQTQPYYQPYIDRGNAAQGSASDQYNQAINDPNSLYARIAAGYKQSPGYQNSLNQALAGSNNASAAGGMLGTPQNQFQDASVAEGLANKDYEDYLNHVLGIYGGGLSGQQHVADTGANAASSYGNLIGNNMNNQANNAFYGQANQNQANSSGLGGLLGGLGSVLGWLL